MTPTIPFALAINDPAIFGRAFAGPTWEPHRVVARAMDGLPLSQEQARIFDTIAVGRQAPTDPVRELWLVKGRRIGGSLVFGGAAPDHAACFSDFSNRLAPGKRVTNMLMCADRRQGPVNFRYCAGLIDASTLLAPLAAARTSESLMLSNGNVIEVHTSSYRAVRGYAIALAVCDELGFWEGDESGANPAEDVLAALRPALANLSGRLVCLSSPHARRGPLWETFARKFGRNDPNVLVVHAPTPLFNPTIDTAIIDRAMAEDEPKALAEWYAQFRRDVESYIAKEVVAAAVVPGRVALPPLAGLPYRAFVDPSGGPSDAMTLAIVHVQGERVVVDVVMEKTAPLSPAVTVPVFADVVRAYGCAQVTGDRYGGEFCREPFRLAGVGYRLSEKPKSELYAAFLPMLNSGRVELPDVPRLIRQLEGLERRTARRGRETIDHAPGGHDDLANAVAGAAVLAGSRRWVATEVEYELG